MVRSVLEVRIQDAALNPALTVLCAGYEMEVWRAPELVDDLFSRHLTSFALSFTEFNSIDGETAARALRRSAEMVYGTDKYRRRGEFGELILHAALIDFFGATPAVSKIYYKDSDNDTVKGFDSVHVVGRHDGELEVWLGEAKFYKDLSGAITEAVKSIEDHLERNFLRREFIAITNKVDATWPHADAFRGLLDGAASLDEIAKSLVIPVLITYESVSVASHKVVDDAYKSALEAEVRTAWKAFSEKELKTKLTITLQLILLPLESKDRLIGLMHEKLKVWQHI
ncbi:DUF1837 domain-containing protein [Glaciibacter flavus]|uniref:DUF1837 domain-containing protein n=1 Tax=Orlajensenia flava TaxID=2565934 RepID=A0A4S4FUZ0_9MICO|nr:DUF1837 domain-containing protein [Glaciibacter flavus]THG34553.1 DUF1837 domain-containing protein [Glaciibacter flavus]